MTQKTIKESSNNSKNSQTQFDTLLDQYMVEFPKIGDLVEGKVIDIAKNAIYLDLGMLGTGIIMGREMKDGLGLAAKLKKGDEAEATVIELENENGYMELSLREAGYEKTWQELERKMKEGEVVETKILAANRGGLMVEINGVTGFLPVSQLSNEHYPRVEDGDKAKILQLLNRFVDQILTVRVIDVDPEEEKLIVSEKATQSEKEEAEVNKFKIGDVVEGIISGIVKFGAFVKFPPKGKKEDEASPKEMLEGLVHISELAWQLIDNPHDIVKIGEKVKCQIIDVNKSKISLSIRNLQTDPWTEVKDKYKVGEIINGTVTKLNPFGAFVQLDESIHGLAHISELNRFAAGNNIEDIMKVGNTYPFKILSIEPKSHRMGLSPFVKEEAPKKASDKAVKTDKKKEQNQKEGEDKKPKPAAKKEVKTKKAASTKKTAKPKGKTAKEKTKKAKA
ncbi:MAG: S1 RNA-binding domain-containing protein [Candidatus Moranbacteria bacterium]|nr:S1 RNA-binding domain-containing protein [Candidatus Moranbacteria bacterium]